VAESDLVVGRELELTLVERFLRSASDGPIALLLEGEAGIGKSTIWRHAVRSALAHGLTVLASRPAEAEAKSSYMVLADLLANTPDPMLQGIPAPQARALRIAVLRKEDGSGRPVNQETVSMGFLSLLRVLTGEGTLILAIDDVQWVDIPSRTVLEFAIRRIADRSIGYLLTRRGPEGSVPPLDLDRAISPDRMLRSRMGPMNLGELHRVIGDKLDGAPARPILVQIERASGGNPFYAVEIARAIRSGPTSPLPGQPLPIPPSLTEVVSQRIRGLPPDAGEAMLLASLTASPTVELIRRAMGAGAGQALARAEGDRLVAIDGSSITFTHPLLSAAASADTGQWRRREAHRRLAGAVDDPEERARHVALSVDGPDEPAAAILATAALRARRRGAIVAAAELAEMALDLTPVGVQERPGRALTLGEYLLAAGDTERARDTLTPLSASAPISNEGVRALLLLARIAWLTGSSVEAGSLAERALAASDDEMLEAESRTQLATLSKHDRSRGLEHAERAISLLERHEGADRGLLARALFARIESEADLGLPVDLRAAVRALELERSDPPARTAERIVYRLGSLLWQLDRLSEGRTYLETALRAAEEEGDEGSIPSVLDQLAQLEVVAGDWSTARGYAVGQVDTASLAMQEMERLWGLETLASIDAHEGEVDGARRTVEEVAESARRFGDPMTEAFALRTLGFSSLSIGDARAADASFTEAEEVADAIGLLSPNGLRLHGDHIEALIELGDHERARSLLAQLERRGDRSSTRWSSAVGERCRALLLAAGGDLDWSVAAAIHSIALVEPLGMPFERARSYLTTGQIHRRRKEKRLAREALGEAHDAFLALGARLWADRAAAELSRVGLRPPAPLDLTVTERSIAELVAGGLTNREVADRLFVTAKTVEGNLTRIYRKLGVRNRAELASLIADSPRP
jgi:DNA-binding CsgD family transcriptional regulator